MHQRETVYEYRHIVAVLMGTIFHLKLIDHLQTIIKDILLIYQLDILCQTVVERQVQHIALALNHLRLVEDGHLLVRYHRQQSRPLTF